MDKKECKSAIIALALGLALGFSSPFNIYTVFVIAGLLLFRIPVFLFVASSLFSFALAYLFEPLFVKTGYFILSAEPLRGFFETVYNTPVLRWSGFNNAAALGGFLTALASAVFVYLLFCPVIAKNISKIKKHPVLKFLLINSAKLRNYTVAAVIVVLGVTAAAVTLFLDPLLKHYAQKILSEKLKKNVYISELKTSLKEPSLQIKGLKIGNDADIENIYVKLSWYYLLWKKIDIKDAKINGIHFNKSLKSMLGFNGGKTSSKQTFKINLPTPQKLLSKYGLKTQTQIERLKKDYSEFLTLKKQILTEAGKKEREISEIKNEITRLEKKAKNIKNINDIENILQQTKNLKKRIENIQGETASYGEKITELKHRVLKDIDSIKKTSLQDYETLSAEYAKIKTDGLFYFSDTLLTPQMKEEIKKYKNKFHQFEKQLNAPAKTADAKPVRKGLYVTYKDKIKFPDFTMEKFTADGYSKHEKIKITASDISDSQALLNKPAKVQIFSTADYYSSIKASASYLKNINTSLEIQKLKLKKMKLNRLLINSAVLNSHTKALFKKESFNTETKAAILANKFSYEGDKKISSLLKHIKKMDLKIKIYGTYENYKIALKSNLDRQLSKIVENEIKKTVQKYKKELKKLIEKQVRQQLQKSGVNIKNLETPQSLKQLNRQIALLREKLKNYTKEKLKKELQNKLKKEIIKKHLPVDKDQILKKLF